MSKKVVNKAPRIDLIQKDKQIHTERVKKLDKLKSAYEKYENQEISSEGFKTIVSQDIGIKNLTNLNRLLSNPKSNKINFKEIVNSTDIIEHKKPEKKMNINYNPKFNKYKKIRPPPISLATKNEYNARIKESTYKFVNDKITPDNYKKILITEGYNINSEDIRRIIKQKEEINSLSYSEAMNTITHHKTDTFDTTKIKQTKGKDCRFREDQGKENKERLMVNNNDGIYKPLKKKRQYFNENLNEFQSDKDLFDWDGCKIHSYNPEKEKKAEIKNEKRIHAKNLDISKEPEFKLEQNYSTRYKRNRNESSVFSPEKQNNFYPPPKYMIRIFYKGHNTTSILPEREETRVKPLIKHLGTLHKCSKDNPFLFNSQGDITFTQNKI